MLEFTIPREKKSNKNVFYEIVYKLNVTRNGGLVDSFFTLKIGKQKKERMKAGDLDILKGAKQKILFFFLCKHYISFLKSAENI